MHVSKPSTTSQGSIPRTQTLEEYIAEATERVGQFGDFVDGLRRRVLEGDALRAQDVAAIVMLARLIEDDAENQMQDADDLARTALDRQDGGGSSPGSRSER